MSLVPSEGCLTSSTPNIWLDVQRGCRAVISALTCCKNSFWKTMWSQICLSLSNTPQLPVQNKPFCSVVPLPCSIHCSVTGSGTWSSYQLCLWQHMRMFMDLYCSPALEKCHWRNATSHFPLLLHIYERFEWNAHLDPVRPSHLTRLFLVSELSFRGFLVSWAWHKKLHLLFLFHLFKVILPSFFHLLLIHVLLPHIWLWAWTHFLELIPSSCLLPALSHRGQGWDPKGKGKWRTSWEHPQQVKVKTTKSLQE